MLTPVYLFSVLALSFLGGTEAAIGPIANLTIVNKIISPDGFNRTTVLSGGTFPGPLIRGTKGNIFKLNVTDALTDKSMEVSTTIHWHGIHQKGHNFADGVAFVTQCPIIPNHSFLYEFPVPNQAGTYWYHSHLSTQYCDGLRGPMVVYDLDDPHKNSYDVDDESTVITLADWYHALASSTPRGAADSTLINGKGRYTGGEMVPLSVIGVAPSKRYRFRLIAMTCTVYFTFSIDGHSLTVIEADGENTVPHVVDSLQIHSGQRYSVILNANQPVNNYWIRANPNAGAGKPGFDNGRNSAILRYTGARIEDPKTVQQPSVNPLRESDLHALTDPAAPGRPVVGGADRVIPLVTGFANGRFTLNNYSWVEPSVPTLLQILSGAHTVQDLLPMGSYYDLPLNKVIEISFPGGGSHPFHLHGHSFSVVRSGDSDTYNFKNPVRRDTVATGTTNGNTTIRFMTDNSGPWILHCHIDTHFELGLAAVFAEDLPGTAANNPVPDAWKNLCPLYNGQK